MQEKTKEKKSIYKRWWFWLIAVIVVGSWIVGGDETGELSDQDKGSAVEVEVDEDKGEEPQDEPQEASKKDAEDDENWDDLKNKDNIVGTSDKDYSEVSKQKPSEVRNDVTGNWRKVTLAEDIDFEDYAKSYQELHMEEGETHFIVNFNRKTTTVINEFNSLLYVDIHEYVEKEEHDANKIGSGMVLINYVIYPDGDIEELEE